MFWSGDLLSINGGRFSTIWLLGLEMDPSTLDKEERKKLQTKELVKVDVRKLLQEFARFVPISEQHVSLRVSIYCVYGFAKVLRVKSKHLRTCVIRDQFLRRLKKGGGKGAAAIDAPPTSAKAVNLKNKKQDKEERQSFGQFSGHVGDDLRSEEYVKFIADFEKEVVAMAETPNAAAERLEEAERSSTVNPNTVDISQITMPDPDVGFRNYFGRRNYDDDDNLGEPLLSQDIDHPAGGLFDAPDLFGELPEVAVTTSQHNEEPAPAAVRDDNQLMTLPDMGGNNFGRLNSDDDFGGVPPPLTQDLGQGVGDEGVGLFDGPGLFDAAPGLLEDLPEPEVTSAHQNDALPAAAPRKRAADDARSDTQTATTTDNNQETKKRKKNVDLTPPPMLDDEVMQQEEPVPGVEVPQQQEHPVQLADELQPVEGLADSGPGQNLSGGLNVEDEVVVQQTPPISFDLQSLEEYQQQPPATGGRRRTPARGRRRRLVMDRDLQIGEEAMKEQIGGEAYRQDACLASGFDDFDAMVAGAKFGRHLQVAKNKKLIMPTTRAGERKRELLNFQQKVVVRHLSGAPRDYFDFQDEEEEEEEIENQQIEPRQEDEPQDLQDELQQEMPEVELHLPQNEPQQEMPEVEQPQQELPEVEPHLPQDQVPELPEVPQEGQEPTEQQQNAEESSWEDIPTPKRGDFSSRIRESIGSRDSTRRDSALRDATTPGGTTTGAPYPHLQVPPKQKKPRSTSLAPPQDPSIEGGSIANEPGLDEQPPLVDEPHQEVSLGMENVAPSVLEPRASVSSFQSQDEEEAAEDPFLVVAQVVERLRDHQGPRPIKFSDVYPPADKEHTTRHVALAFQHLLTLQNQGKVDMAQHEANFRGPVVIDLLF